MKKILDYYIIKKFLLIFSLTIFSFITISTLVNIIDHLDKFIDRNLSSEEILSYYILTLPHIISITLPMSLLVSTIFIITLWTPLESAPTSAKNLDTRVPEFVVLK